MIPRRALGDSHVRVLAAVTDGCVTYAELIDRTGLSRAYLHRVLHKLRDEGLVAFEDRTQGTLRPLVRESHEHLFSAARIGATTEVDPGAAQTAPGPAITCKEATADGT